MSKLDSRGFQHLDEVVDRLGRLRRVVYLADYFTLLVYCILSADDQCRRASGDNDPLREGRVLVHAFGVDVLELCHLRFLRS